MKAIYHTLEQELSQSRREHTLAVAQCALDLARALDLSAQQLKGLEKAALLHDLTKEKPLAWHQSYLRERRQALGPDELKSPAVVHALSAALVAQEEFGLEAPYAQAIRYHTTGHPDMELLDKILFTADYVEPTRPHPACRRQALWLEKNLALAQDRQQRLAILNQAVYNILDATCQHLQEKGQAIHPATLQTLLALCPNGKEPQI